MDSETELLEEKLAYLLDQIKAECGIFERMVYKNKNQHRRCSYFQYLLKVGSFCIALLAILSALVPEKNQKASYKVFFKNVVLLIKCKSKLISVSQTPVDA